MTYNEADMETRDEAPQQDTNASTLRAHLEKTNLVDELTEEQHTELSQQVKRGFDADMRSREHWEKCLDEWTKLALQVKEQKTWPWVGASNVKYPLVSTASMQFNARSYPALIPATSNVVKVEVIGKDLDGSKLEKATRIGTYMSYQVLNEMECWEEDMDKLLIMLPVIGTIFKKTFYNTVKKQNVSELVLPKNLVVNYWAKSLDTAERVSQIIEMNRRVLKEKQMAKIYSDVDLGDPQQELVNGPTPEMDDTTPYHIIEQHTYFDMDDDGYAEPYVVVFERFSGELLRVAPRYDEKSIHLSDDGTLEKIDPIQYFTKFSFIPNPDGGFYDIGFGLLLSPINEAVNTLINQLVDSGTLANLQGGFLGKGLKLKMGESRWTPGEWKTVQSTSDDLRKQIVPLPAKEPSNVLFELMGTLITSGKELASIAEIMVGKMPGQNTPATTTMATIEQGMKVFTAVYKRVYRSLKSEFKKIFALNGIYLDPEKYQNIVDVQIMPDDFSPDDYDVCPGADPNSATQTEKLMKAQGLMELLPIGILDPVKVVQRILEAQEQPSWEQLIKQEVMQTGQMPPPPPDPKAIELQMKGQLDQQKFQLDQQKEAMKSELAQRDQAFQHMMQAAQASNDERHEAMMTQIKAAGTLHQDRARVQGELAKTHQAVVQSEQQHVQKLTQNAQTHQQKMQQSKEQAKLVQQQARAKPSSSGGSKK